MNLSFDSMFTSNKLNRTVSEAVNNAAGAALFQNVLVLQANAGYDHGIGFPEMKYWIHVTETVTGLGGGPGAGITFTLRTSDIDPAGVVGTGDILATQTVAAADLNVGAHPASHNLPRGCKRFLWVEYAVTGSVPTAGTVSIGLNHADDNYIPVPSHSFSDH